MELRHLRYFLAVIEELHFGRAAERLHMAQPALSRAIRGLEDELGIALLYRTSRVVTPTEAGRVFAEEARKVLASADSAVAEARWAAGTSSALRVGCVSHLPIDRVHRLLSALRERESSLDLRVEHLSAPEQVRGLRGGELDLGIFNDAGHYDGIDTAPLFGGEPLGGFVPAGHPLAAKRVLTPDDLEDWPLVLLPRDSDPSLHERLLSLLEDAGYPLQRVHEAPGPSGRDALLTMVQAGGVAVWPMPLPDVADSGTFAVGRALDPPLAMPDVVAAWSTNASRRVKALRATIHRIARELRNV